jgi:integrase
MIIRFRCKSTHLLPKWANTPVVELTTRDLRLWIMTLKGKSKTIQLILTPLRNAVELAVTEDVIPQNPFDSIKLGKLLPREQRVSAFKADPFDIDEIDAILNSCSRVEEHNMLLFAFTTGMRPSEYIALHWSAVNDARYEVAVQGAFVDGKLKDRAKTLHGLRNIDLRIGTLAALQGQRNITSRDGPVFLNHLTGEPWTGDKQIYRRWTRILSKSGVRFRNPYQTRHTFASSLLMLGAVPLYVASQMGHADTTMIMRVYGKWINSGLDHDRRERLLRLYRQTNPLRANEFPNFN